MDFAVIIFPWQWIKIAFFAVFDSFLFFTCPAAVMGENVCLYTISFSLLEYVQKKRVNMQMPADASNKQWILICLDCMSFNAHYIAGM